MQLSTHVVQAVAGVPIVKEVNLGQRTAEAFTPTDIRFSIINWDAVVLPAARVQLTMVAAITDDLPAILTWDSIDQLVLGVHQVSLNNAYTGPLSWDIPVFWPRASAQGYLFVGFACAGLTPVDMGVTFKGEYSVLTQARAAQLSILKNL